MFDLEKDIKQALVAGAHLNGPDWLDQVYEEAKADFNGTSAPGSDGWGAAGSIGERPHADITALQVERPEYAERIPSLIICAEGQPAPEDEKTRAQWNANLERYRGVVAWGSSLYKIDVNEDGIDDRLFMPRQPVTETISTQMPFAEGWQWNKPEESPRHWVSGVTVVPGVVVCKSLDAYVQTVRMLFKAWDNNNRTQG